VLEEPYVLLRRAEEHRHLVERHAASRLVEDAPDDLDCFAALAGRGEQRHIARSPPFRRPPRPPP